MELEYGTHGIGNHPNDTSTLQGTGPFAGKNTPLTLPDITAQAGSSPAVVRGLISRGLLTKTPSVLPKSVTALDATQPGPCFSPDQQ